VSIVPRADEPRQAPTNPHAASAASRIEELERLLASEKHRLIEVQAVARVGSWETDLATFEVTWSRETFRIFETAPERFKPTHAAFLALVHPDDREAVDAAFLSSVGASGPFAIEHRVVLGGRVKYVEERWQSFPAGAHGPARAVGTCQDISERRQREDEAARLHRAVKLLGSCNRALLGARTEQELIQAACSVAVGDGGYRMAWIGVARHDQQSTVEPLAWAGVEEGYLGQAKVLWDERHPNGRGPVGQVIRTGQPAFFEDIDAPPELASSLDLSRKRGYRALVCLPLRWLEGSAGVIALYSAELRRPDAVELALLQEMADNLAFGLATLRAQEEGRRLQEAVMKVAGAVSAAQGEAFFEQLARSMADTLGCVAAMVAELLPEAPGVCKTVAGVAGGAALPDLSIAFDEVALARLQQPGPGRLGSGELGSFRAVPALARLPLAGAVLRRLEAGPGEPIGLLVALFAAEWQQPAFVDAALQIFAARAGSELERRRTDARLREQTALLDSAHEAIMVKGLDDRIVYWNKGAERIYGWSAAEALGTRSAALLHKSTAAFESAHAALMEKGEWQGELAKHNKQGREIIAEVRWTLVRDAQGAPKAVLAINSDVTEKKKLASQFLRAQRMEGIGTLAGGIAHDLNNVLAPLLMSVQYLRTRLPEADDQDLLDTLEQSCRRGASLVQQVLSFARGVEGQRVIVNLVHLTRELLKVVRETFPPNIETRFVCETGQWMVKGDPTQLHQVLLNLCVNARDAMPAGGALRISIANVVLDEAYAAMNPRARPGPHLRVTVEDSGIGIPPELQGRIFEPFFTTKELGKGTGLGLSTTDAIVKSHGGFITVMSEVGRGASFVVHLPALPDATAEGDLRSPPRPLPRGNGELVLVVDDEAAVRTIAKTILEQFGYRVLQASNGAEAVAIYATRPGEVAAVLTDMSMPVMNGAALIATLKVLNPAVRVIGSSGGSSDRALEFALSAGSQGFLAKPYTAEALLGALRALLRP
jgi:PAS domain S-box-containing protein